MILSQLAPQWLAAVPNPSLFPPSPLVEDEKAKDGDEDDAQGMRRVLGSFQVRYFVSS